MMSSRNGDKSRFNRQRKQNIARRKRTHEPAGAHSKGTQSSGDLIPLAATFGVGMNTTLPPPSLLSAPIPSGVKKKRVLLVDASREARIAR
jgi:hypothetical protein